MTKKPTIALMYDFDKTLCTSDMQNYTFIPSLGVSEGEFWSRSDKLSVDEHMDRMLAYLYLMLRQAKENNIPIRRDDFVALGKSIEYFPGVVDWFARISNYAKEHGAKVEHYIISSGLAEIIEGSSIYSNFKKVYACEYLYDVNGVAVWPKSTVNYTAKTQYLFRINKGVLDISDDDKLNDYVPEDERPIPFRNMIYIGDGMTDVPCMKLVKVNGGQSIAVFSGSKKATAKKLMKDNRVDFTVKADYTDGGELDTIVKNVIDKMIVVDKLTRLHRKQKKDICK